MSQTRPKPTGVEVPEILLSRVGGDLDLLRKLLAIYRETTPRLREGVREALARGEAASLAQAVHKLLGSLLHFHSADAVSLARQLQELARQGDLTTATTVMAELEPALDWLDGEVARLAEKLG